MALMAKIKMLLAEFLWRFCSPNTTELKIPQGFNQDHTGGAKLTVIGLYGSQSNKNAREINFERIFPSAARLAAENGTKDIIKKAFHAMKTETKYYVAKTSAPINSSNCILVGIISGGRIHVASSGHYRVVLGRSNGVENVVGEQMSDDLLSKGFYMKKICTEHSDLTDSMRVYTTVYPGDDCSVIVTTVGSTQVDGFIQICKDMGNAVPKSSETDLNSQAWHALPPPFNKSCLAFANEREVEHQDLFLIFASEGLWKHMTIQEAVEFVHHSERNGVAQKLASKALEVDTRVVVMWLNAHGSKEDKEPPLPCIDANWPLLDDSTRVQIFCPSCFEHIDVSTYPQHVRHAHP